MHEKERHRIILSAVQDKPVVTVQELVDLTDSSEATIRRDIAALHLQKKLRRVRGGAEAGGGRCVGGAVGVAEDGARGVARVVVVPVGKG